MKNSVLTFLNSLIHRFYGPEARTYTDIGMAWERLTMLH